MSYSNSRQSLKLENIFKMSLPIAFNDEDDFFEEALKFLEHNQALYNYPNTDILIENILEEINIDPENTDVFGKDFNIADVAQLNDIFEAIEKLKYHHKKTKFKNFDAEYFKNLPLGSKKKHEINYLSQVVHKKCEKLNCNTVVDFGCGLGYLDQLLFKKYNYQVLGLEYNEVCLNGALKRQLNYHSESIDNVKYVKHHVSDSSGAAILKLLEEQFPKSGDFCIVGLHACADLTVDAIDIFLKTKRAKGLVLMSCCYHKMSLKESDAYKNVDFNEKFKNADETIQPDATNTVESAQFKENISLDQYEIRRKLDLKSAGKCQSFNKFPLSESLKRIHDKYEAFKFLRIPFLRLAAQPPSVAEDLELLSFRLLSRATLQLYCYKHSQRLVLKKRRAVKLTSQMHDFNSYIFDATKNGYSLKCDSEFCSSIQADKEVQNSSHGQEKCKCSDGFDTEELLRLWQNYSNDLAFKKAAILILFQRYLQPMLENLVLLDRIVYLKENRVERCSFVKIVDERISPRCLALVASK